MHSFSPLDRAPAQAYTLTIPIDDGLESRPAAVPSAVGTQFLKKAAMFARRSLIFVVLGATSMCGHASPTSPTGNRGPQTVYVSPAGDNRNSGTIASPWQTIRFALSKLEAGDTLYMRSGTYTGGDNTIDSQVGTLRSGTAWSNPITISGYTGESVTIQPPGGLSGIRLTTGAPAYLIFQDFTIDMANSTQSGGSGGADGVYLSGGAHHNRFQRLEVKNGAANGFQFSNANGNSPFNEVLNCVIHDNGSAPGINTGYGLYIFTSDNVLEGNDVRNNGGYGLHFYNNSGPLNVARNVIRNNNVHDNGTHGGNNYGIAVAWGDGNQIYGNRIYGNRGGILVYTNSTNAKVYNNVIYGNAPLENILIQYATDTIVQDNVIDAAAGIVDLGNGTRFLGKR
jgi:hypothetical protein